jgi:hypothetical protein
MEGISATTPTKYEQVTVEVPEERLAEFHAFFARFLGGRSRRRRHGDHRRHGHGRGRGCAEGAERAERAEPSEGPAATSSRTPESTEL